MVILPGTQSSASIKHTDQGSISGAGAAKAVFPLSAGNLRGDDKLAVKYIMERLTLFFILHIELPIALRICS
jgi:hypothetical protein